MKVDVKSLKEILQYIPESAMVYSYADHGQQSEQVNNISVTNCDELRYYGEDSVWFPVTIEELKTGIICKYSKDEDYEEEDDDSFPIEKITAIVIG